MKLAIVSALLALSVIPGEAANGEVFCAYTPFLSNVIVKQVKKLKTCLDINGDGLLSDSELNLMAGINLC